MANDETPRRNVEALKTTGVILEGLPEDYHPVFESLSNQELAALMLLKARLDDVKGGGVDDYQEFVPL
jgi:hypothetical protein